MALGSENWELKSTTACWRWILSAQPKPEDDRGQPQHEVRLSEDQISVRPVPGTMSQWELQWLCIVQSTVGPPHQRTSEHLWTGWVGWPLHPAETTTHAQQGNSYLEINCSNIHQRRQQLPGLCTLTSNKLRTVQVVHLLVHQGYPSWAGMSTSHQVGMRCYPSY